jgi:hypothetical protein
MKAMYLQAPYLRNLIILLIVKDVNPISYKYQTMLIDYEYFFCLNNVFVRAVLLPVTFMADIP